MPNWTLIGAITLPSFGGWAGALSMAGQVRSPNGKAWYQTIKKPRWTPANKVFGRVWITLYTSMGYASYLVYNECGGFTDKSLIPLALFGGQLLINWTWTPVFFRCHAVGLALLQMLALDVAATACAASFFSVNKTAAFFMTPYLCWLVFGTALNYSIWQLNKDKNDN